MDNFNPNHELELIDRIQKTADGSALTELCNIYRPMINTVKSKYFLRLYDEQDWDQEAMIVCYQSAMDFSAARGKFGSYFKRRLNNHAISLLRCQLSAKRKANNDSISWEKLLIDETSAVMEPQVADFNMPNSMVYGEWLNKLSDLELASLLINLGKIDEEYVKSSLNVDSKAISRARFRALQKIRKALFE